MHKKQLLKMNLQFFAEDKGNDDSSSNETGGENDIGAEGEKKNEGQKKNTSFDDVLADETLKKEFDSRIAVAVEAAKNERKTEVDEAQKLEKMTKEEKAVYELQKKQNDLATKEAEIIKRELRLAAIEQLRGANIPDTLVEVIDLSNAENCKKSIETVSKAFNDAVMAEVNEKLKENGSVMKKASGSGEDNELAKKIREAVRG